MFENIVKFFKGLGKKEKEKESSDTAKERLHLVLMQDRANVSADFLELMKQEIIEVIKKYIDVDEKAIDVRLTNKTNEDGTVGAPALYANIPITTIKDEARKANVPQNKENTSKVEESKEKDETNKKSDKEEKSENLKEEKLENEKENKGDVTQEEKEKPEKENKADKEETNKKEVSSKKEEADKTKEGEEKVEEVIENAQEIQKDVENKKEKKVSKK